MLSGLKSFLKKDLELTRQRWGKALEVFRAHPKIDESLYEDLEAQLLQADVGTAATAHLVEKLRDAQRRASTELVLYRSTQIERHRDG